MFMFTRSVFQASLGAAFTRTSGEILYMQCSINDVFMCFVPVFESKKLLQYTVMHPYLHIALVHFFCLY